MTDGAPSLVAVAKGATLCELLAGAAARSEGGFFFHSDGGVLALPPKELYARALRRAAQFVGLGIGVGTRVGLVGPNAPEWAEWAWGVWLSGAALVPLPAPVLMSDPAAFSAEVSSLLRGMGCLAVVGKRWYLEAIGPGPWATLDWSSRPPEPLAVHVDVSPSDLATVLSTSGSTASPKGVRMTHARAVEWARCNVIPRRDGRAAAMVTWFPFHHIAGLGTLFEVAEPAEQHFLPMKQFLGDPSKWLRLVSQTRASYAVSPSSVWAEALRGVSENPGGIDLSCLERAVFNAEMVDPEVLERLQEVCLPLGLPSGAIAVHYASSEAGMISHTEPTGEVRVDRVDLEVLATSGKAVPARREGPVKEVVSCGVPYPGTEICIGGPSRPLPERELGEIWARGPGVADGYVNVEDEGRFLDGWLRVGDLGYMAEGELFVTGRADEVVVHFGHKYNPEDIEQSVRHATGLGPGSCLAFSPVGGRPGELVVLVENDKQDRDLAGFIIQAVARGIGIAPTDVVFVPRGTMPATANGKLQRSRARAMYAKGELPPG